MMQPAQPLEQEPWVVHLGPTVKVTPDQFQSICHTNRDWRFELTAEGGLVIMPPTGGETGAQNLKLAQQLGRWADQDGSGVTFDSSTGFVLPNGAIRSPDAAWVARARLAPLSRAQKRKFLPLCPDFVVELKSPTDPLPMLHTKLREYIGNGARLGWLIDPERRIVYVYRPRAGVARRRSPTTLSADPVLPGFVLNLGPVWNPGL